LVETKTRKKDIAFKLDQKRGSEFSDQIKGKFLVKENNLKSARNKKDSLKILVEQNKKYAEVFEKEGDILAAMEKAFKDSIQNLKPNPIVQEVKAPSTKAGLIEKHHILGRTKALIIKLLNAKPKEVLPNASLTKNLGVDNLDLAELLIKIEEEFDIYIPDEEFVEVDTFQDLVTLIKKHGGSSAN